MMAAVFMTTSQPRCRRRSSGLFVTLAKNHLLRLAVVVLMMTVLLTASAVADTPAREHAPDDGVTYIHGCSDLVNDRTPVHGYVRIVGDVLCEMTKTIEVAEGREEVIIVATTAALRTKGVRFEVRQGARVRLQGPGFFFERNQDNTDAIFQVDGFLGFEADDASYEAPQSATPEDAHALVRTAPGATARAHYHSAMYYTDSSVMVVRESKSKNGNNSAKSNTDTGTTDTSNSDTDSTRRSLRVVDDVPLSTLHSCDELRSKRTRVQGVAGALLLDFDIVCPEKRVLEVTDNLLIMSNKPDLRLKGVHFHVRKKAALTFMVPTLTLEKLEGVSGPLFTIEPQGSVEMNADQWVPPPDNGTEEDVFSLVAVKKGASFELEEGHARYKASTITFFMQQQQNDNIDNDKLGNSRSTAVEPPHSTADIIEKQQQQQQQQDNSNNPSMSRSTAEPLHSTADTNEQQQQQQQQKGDVLPQHPQSGDNNNNNNNNNNPPLTASGDADSYRGNTNMHTKEKIRAMRDRLPYSSSDRPPTTTIYSCEQFPFDRNPVVGVLIIEGNIVCKKKRTLVVSERAYLFSHMDEVHLEGVHFIVEENAALGIAVATLHVEKLEGDSGEIFTIDPGGFLGGHADQLRPLPENGTKKDEHSLLHAKEGGEFHLEALVLYTSSSITMVTEPVIEDPAWIRLQRLRRRWIERHFQLHQQQGKQQQQQQQQQQMKHDGGQSACTAAASLTCGPNQSPFSPDRSAEYTYEQRLGLNPTHLMVGEELRFPSSLTTLDQRHMVAMGTDSSLVLASEDRFQVLAEEMVEAVENKFSAENLFSTASTISSASTWNRSSLARTRLLSVPMATMWRWSRVVGEELRFPSSLTTLDRSHTMTMGTDGSLVLAKADRYVVLFDEMIEAVETRASVEETTMATLAGLSPDYDGGDPGLELKILALADSGQVTDDKVLHMMARSERLRVWQKETATDMEVDLEKCARGFDELLRAKKRERDLQMEKEEEEEKEAEKTTMPQQQADPTTAAGHSSDPKQEHAGQDASSTRTSTSTSGRGKTKAKAKAVPATVTRYWGDEARRYWGDDVALKVTNTGDVLVTVGDLVVVQKRNPMWTKKKESWLQRKVAKSKPVKKIKDVFGRLGRRGKGNGKTDNKARSDDDDDSKGNGDGAPVSTMYSLHVVENGFEVRLEGVFMWGWYAE